LQTIPRINFQAAGDLINHPDLDIIGFEAINTGFLKHENIEEDIKIKLNRLKVIIHPQNQSPEQALTQ